MAAPREHLELFLEDLAQAADACFRFNTNIPPESSGRIHLPSGGCSLRLSANRVASDTRLLQFGELKRPERTHAIVIHAGDEEYTIFQGATLRALLAYAVRQLLLDQDPRIQLFRFELRRGLEFLEDIIAKAKEPIQASGQYRLVCAF